MNIPTFRRAAFRGTVMAGAAFLLLLGSPVKAQGIVVAAAVPVESLTLGYITLRERIEDTVPASRVTADAAEITGRHLVARDARTNLIADYLANATTVAGVTP